MEPKQPSSDLRPIVHSWNSIGKTSPGSVANLVRPVLWVLVTALLAACGGTRRGAFHVEGTVGPRPETLQFHSISGNLVVYSAWDSTTIGDPDFRHHTSYSIFADSGEPIRRIENRGGESDENPVAVALPPGHYRIEAQASGFGRVSVSLLIGENQTTTIHLDGSTKSAHFKENDPNVVRLPNGQVVGWRAVTS